MVRVLIIGGTGFIGINLTLELERRGYDVAIIGNRQIPPTICSAVPTLKVYKSHLSDYEAIYDIIRLKRPNLVLHMASTLKPNSTGDHFIDEHHEIFMPTVRLINLLVINKTPLIFVSSGGTVYGSSNNNKLSEHDSCNPISFYGQAKLELETYIRFAHRALGLSYLILRPSNPYGPFQPLKSGQGLISVILGNLLRGDLLEVWGDGSAIRDYIHIDDTVRSICTILERNVWNQTFNIGSGVGHSLLEVVGAVEHATGRRVPLAFKPSRSVDVDRIVLDVSRLISLDAWHHRPLEEGIRSYAKHLGFIDGE